MAKTILVITDKHERENCSLIKAHDIAAPMGEDIEVIRFIKEEDKHDAATLANSAQELTATLSDIFEDYPHKDAIKSQVVVTKDVARWVTEYCETRRFDLIIKTGHRSESLFHTPCDWELIRNVSVPVLIAHHHRWNCKHALMTAIDPTTDDAAHTELNNTILDWTRKWASTFDCQVHVVYCIPVSGIQMDLDMIDVRQHERKHRAEAEEKLAAVVSPFDIPNVQLHVTVGEPEKMIPHCANDLKAEMVVMGSMGRSGLSGMIFGNVAEKVMHYLRTDSLIIEAKK
ncbi:universal stress protein [Planctobacterium marinum]|uniref:universal stress protein n=1 Tax=Planctobacterium marinum TaxID=1631968 RepID=UPI001E3BC1B0|nr:universal stress protein [Planctobacterium marinum]MCC2604939.1 universal stress protein [Planctobacterium marinum]